MISLCRRCYAVPYSNTEVERRFMSVNSIRADQTNHLSEEILSHFMDVILMDYSFRGLVTLKAYRKGNV